MAIDEETEEDVQEFREMWMDARNKFEEQTQLSLSQSNAWTLERVEAELNKRFDEKEPETGPKQKRLKGLVTNVLSFIKLLGGIAAQGASMVFGPANLCFNALQYLINIPAKISKFYDDLEHLFRKMFTFMQQFKIYQRIEQYAKVDVELKKSTQSLLITFIDLCAFSIDALGGSRRKRFVTGVKIALFDNDSGVTAKLEEFERLIKHQSQISDAVTLEHVLKSESEMSTSMKAVIEKLNRDADSSRQLLEQSRETREDVKTVKTGVETVVKDTNERIDQKKQRELMNKICQKLDVSGYEEQPANFEKTRKEGLPGTGAWLEQLDIYKRWVTPESSKVPLLVLSGATGSGKSTLASAMFERLRKIRFSNTEGYPMRVSLACYAFRRNEKSLQASALGAFKSLAAQIANHDVVYRKHLWSYLELKDPSFSRDLTATELSQQLLPPSSMKDTPDVAYIVILDGVDQLPLKESYQLFGAVRALDSSQIRFAITITDDVLQDCLKRYKLDENDVSVIRVEDWNEPDIASFIRSELNHYMSQWENFTELPDIAEKMRRDLPEVVKGNFNNVTKIVSRVNEAIESEEDVEPLISATTLENLDAQIEKTVTELNLSLRSQEIEQLNELLAWTLSARCWMSIDQMRGALFLRTKRLPRQNLEQKIKEKYSKLLKILTFDDDVCRLDWRDANVEAFFSSSTRTIAGADSDDPRISMDIKISNVQISKVQRFFWDLSERAVLHKFEFTKPLTDAGSATTIKANTVESHLTIIKRCFEVLLDEPSKETEELDSYALPYLPSHLASLREDQMLSLTQAEEKEEIVSHLVRLLQSPDDIEKHLNQFCFAPNDFWVQYEAPGMSSILDWLRDSEATGKLIRKDQAWVRSATSGSGAQAFRNIVNLIARHWLCKKTWPVDSLFLWLDNFLDRSSELEQLEERATRDSQGGESERESQPAESPKNEGSTQQPLSAVTRISRAVDLVEKEVQGITKDSLWFERLASTYLSQDENDHAQKLFLQAKELSSHPWEIAEGLAETYAQADDNLTAIQETLPLIEYLRSLEALSDDEKDNLSRNLTKIGKWQVELQNFSDAEAKFREAIRLTPKSYVSHNELLKILIGTDRARDAQEFINEMAKQPANKEDLSQLEAMLIEFSTWFDGFRGLPHYERIFQVTEDDDTFEVVLYAIEKTLKYVERNNMMSAKVMLLLSHGLALDRRFRRSGGNAYTEQALSRWTECYKLGFNSEAGQDWMSASRAIIAARFVFNYHFTAIKKSSATDYQLHESSLQGMVEAASSSSYSTKNLRYMFGRFYYQSGQQQKAHELLVNDLKSGLDLLNDDDPENDVDGYDMIAQVLMHAGHDVDAMSAWSLLGPPERHRIDNEQQEDSKQSDSQIENLTAEHDNMSMMCDGRCGIQWTWSDSFWTCKVCDDVAFDDKCLQKLLNGTLQCLVCSPDHEWLLVPSWREEFRATGKDHVRVGGELHDNKRIGGEIIPVNQWLNTIREKWGMERVQETKP